MNKYDYMVNIQKQNHNFNCQKECTKNHQASKKKEKSVESEEEKVEEEDMTPEGDLSQHADLINKMHTQFSDIKELNYLWMKSKE